MLIRRDPRASGTAARRACRHALLAALSCAVVLAGCDENGAPRLSAAPPRGASVAFESIDGPPPDQFHKLVQYLNEEAKARRLAVVSRATPSAFRVRGYLAAGAVRDAATVSWVWDLFDREQHRRLRVSGSETVRGGARDPWHAVDDAVLRHIARSSMDELAAFLTSPAIAPGAPAAEDAPQVALAAPEAPGTLRDAHAGAERERETAPQPAEAWRLVSVPLPPRPPAPSWSPAEPLALAAARLH